MNISATLEKELRTCLRLILNPDIGAPLARALLGTFQFEIFEKSEAQLQEVCSAEQAQQILAPLDENMVAAIEQHLHWASQEGNYLVTLADPLYPQSLLQVDNPPIILFAKGQIDTLKAPKIAMVGARNATMYGLDNARKLAGTLVKNYVVVSGLALGVDAACHEGAMLGRSEMATIAVTATGLDYIYPPQNKELAYRIIENGLMLSEYPLGKRAQKFHFPRRNRLIAGLSKGVVVVEADLSSGSLLTAKYSMNMGKEIFAIPGSIHSPLSRGCHQLIREGAKLVESAQDIFNEYPSDSHEESMSIAQQYLLKEVSEQEEKFLRKMGFEALSVDELIRHTGLDLAGLNMRLIQLEMAGCIVRLPDGRYQQVTGR